MGIGIRIYLVNDDDTLKRFPLARFERLLRRDEKERLREYAGKRVRYVLAAVDMFNRKPVTLLRLEFNYLALNPEGRLDERELQEAMRTGAEMLSPLQSGERHTKIVDARHLFARRRWEAKYIWEPTPQIEKAVIEAIFESARP